MKYLKQEEYVYKDTTIRMSKRAMSDLLYAAIICQAGLPTFFGVGIYEYGRDSNRFNNVDVKVHIHPSMIHQFEIESQAILREPVRISVNNS